MQVLKPKYRVEECLSEIRECLEIGWTGMGYKTVEFEDEWCKYTGCKNAHFLTSATAGHHPISRLPQRKRSMDPEPEPSAGWHVAQHLISLKPHGVRVGANPSVCTYWTCGIPETPALHADFSAVSSLDLDWCSRCLKSMGR